MAGLYAPLPTLRRRPRGRLRTARGRCGSLLLHRSGLSPHTPCRSPGAHRGRDAHCWAPPAQIRTAQFRHPAPTSGRLTSKRTIGRLSYAVQRLGHAHPALCPVRALLIRVPLGPRPWLHRLRSRSPGFVRRLRGYSAGSDFSGSCIGGYGSSPSRRGPRDPTGPMADPEISRFPRKERPYMPGS